MKCVYDPSIFDIAFSNLLFSTVCVTLSVIFIIQLLLASGIAPLMMKIPSNWIYRGEGNCHLAISLPTERKILRIRKHQNKSSLLSWLLNLIADILFWCCGSGVDEEQRDLKFYKRIIRPLIGESFVCDANQVVLSRKEIENLEKKLACLRPQSRKMKSLQPGRASLFVDYAYLPHEYYACTLSNHTFAIEIKPKQGWIPLKERHYPKCIFCMNQFLKLDKGQIKSISSYCPIDLFSGDTDRMVKALKALIQNPQNNFKIFKNGRHCYGETDGPETFENFINEFFESANDCLESLVLEFCLLLKNCLLENFEDAVSECKTRQFCQYSETSSMKNKLPEGCVLQKILFLQMLDLEGNQYYYKTLDDGHVGEYDYVNQLLEERSEQQEACVKCIIMTLRNTYLKFVPYLISTIAKDCSLMLTFREVKQCKSDRCEMKNVIGTKYGRFVANVGVFDLYPKPVSTAAKIRKKHKILIETYNKQSLN